MLNQLEVLDAGVGMAGTLPAKMAAELGARVVRIVDDADDPFRETYPAYRQWQSAKERVTNLTDEGLAELLEDADVCIVGGEDFPGYQPPFRAAELSARYPRLVVLDIVGAPAGGPGGHLPAHDLLGQARSGVVWEHFTERPFVFAVPLAAYGAILQGLIMVVSALYERESTGQGQVVTASFLEGAISWNTSLWVQAEQPDETVSGILPKDMRFPVIRCGDGRWLSYTHGTGGSTPAVDRVLGITEEDRAGVVWDPHAADDYFGSMTLIDAKALEWEAAPLAAEFLSAGIPAEVVLRPGEAWDDEQLRINGTMRADEEGSLFVGLPFRYR